MEREARSQQERQALQAANNKDAKHQQSILVKLRGRAPRPPAQRLGGVSLGTPLARAGSTDRLKQRKVLKTAPKRHPGGSQIAPKSLPKPTPRAESITDAFLAPFVRLLGGSRGAPGSLLAAPGPVLAPLGPLLVAPGALLGGIFAPRGSPFGAFWVSFLKPFRKPRKP